MKKGAYQSKKDYAYETLYEEILTGELPPGTRLVIDDAAERLGVSAIPIREALQRLELDGFVVIEPFVGARVSDLHAGLVEEVFQLMEAIEYMSARRAATRMSIENLDQMKSMLEAMDRAIDDVELWAQQNIDLHIFICKCADMQLASGLFSQLAKHWDRLRRFYLQGVLAKRIDVAQQGHWDLLSALESRDPKKVELVVRSHNQAALAAYVAHISNLPADDALS